MLNPGSKKQRLWEGSHLHAGVVVVAVVVVVARLDMGSCALELLEDEAWRESGRAGLGRFPRSAQLRQAQWEQMMLQ